jgi:hypothetical protein
MTTIQADYFTAYSSVKMTRDVKGVLVVELHSQGGPLTFTARDHTDFVDAFYGIGQEVRIRSSSSREQEATSSPASTSPHSAMWPTRLSGVGFTMKVSRFSRIC